MNGKKSKELRRLARSASSPNAPERRTTDRRLYSSGVEEQLPEVQRQYVGASQRGVYRALKKMSKENAR